MAPLIRDRKGEYRKEIDEWRRDGWMRARIDGEVVELDGAVVVGILKPGRGGRG